ncbi:MAG: peptidylprolyl isomerase [Desulfatibacillum sp.]|nr:peptidylprolyl isomerase [Desulfatibacillum sp.]
MVVLAVLLCLGSCSPKEESSEVSKSKISKAPEVTQEVAAQPRVLVKTTLGEFQVELRPDLTPVTVENFFKYVDEGFYSGKVFHRVIDGFMIQGGGFDAQMNQAKVHAPIVNEAPKGLKNLTGTIAMARTGDINSATAQFFINVKDNHFLDHVPGNARSYGYAAFGKVVQGMDVVTRISRVETGSSGFFKDVPRTPVLIESISRVVDAEN